MIPIFPMDVTSRFPPPPLISGLDSCCAENPWLLSRVNGKPLQHLQLTNPNHPLLGAASGYQFSVFLLLLLLLLLLLVFEGSHELGAFFFSGSPLKEAHPILSGGCL